MGDLNCGVFYSFGITLSFWVKLIAVWFNNGNLELDKKKYDPYRKDNTVCINE